MIHQWAFDEPLIKPSMILRWTCDEPVMKVHRWSIEDFDFKDFNSQSKNMNLLNPAESYKNVNKSSPPKDHKRPNFLMLFQDNLTPLAYKQAYMN